MHFPEEFLLGAAIDQSPELSKKRLSRLKRFLRSRRLSANTVVDIGNTCQFQMSIVGNVQSGGPPSPCSGAVIGLSCDMIHSDTYCNLVVVGASSSGQLRVQVQCSDTDTSGTYTDPTSGLASFPGAFTSGGLLFINSGGAGNGLLGPFTSGQAIASGFGQAQAFQRTGRFTRANLLSGDFGAGVSVGFISQYKTTGSGGGFTWSPQSGPATVNV